MAIQYLALTSMVVLYCLMFLGGYISAAGLGLTCPEWPLCPDGVMPSEEYLIEWIHRLAAATTGVLIVATMVASFLNRRADLKIKITSSLAAVFVVVQIALGALVIDLKLHAVLVAIHLGIGILLFSMVLLTTLFAFRMVSGSSAAVHRTINDNDSAATTADNDTAATTTDDDIGHHGNNPKGKRTAGSKNQKDHNMQDAALEVSN